MYIKTYIGYKRISDTKITYKLYYYTPQECVNPKTQKIQAKIVKLETKIIKILSNPKKFTHYICDIIY